MNPLSLNKSNTTKFMLAMIFNDEATYNDILHDDFIDSYISDFYRPENDGCIMVVKTTEDAPRGTINDPIKKYQNDDDWVFVYEIPDERMDDYAYIVAQDYYSLSAKYKAKLLHFWECDSDCVLNDVLNVLSVMGKVYAFNILKEMYKVTPRDLYNEIGNY